MPGAGKKRSADAEVIEEGADLAERRPKRAAAVVASKALVTPKRSTPPQTPGKASSAKTPAGSKPARLKSRAATKSPPAETPAPKTPGKSAAKSTATPRRSVRKRKNQKDEEEEQEEQEAGSEHVEGSADEEGEEEETPAPKRARTTAAKTPAKAKAAPKRGAKGRGKAAAKEEEHEEETSHEKAGPEPMDVEGEGKEEEVGEPLEAEKQQEINHEGEEDKNGASEPQNGQEMEGEKEGNVQSQDSEVQQGSSDEGKGIEMEDLREGGQPQGEATAEGSIEKSEEAQSAEETDVAEGAETKMRNGSHPSHNAQLKSAEERGVTSPKREARSPSQSSKSKSVSPKKEPQSPSKQPTSPAPKTKEPVSPKKEEKHGSPKKEEAPVTVKSEHPVSPKKEEKADDLKEPLPGIKEEDQKAIEPGKGILEKGHIYFLYRPKVMHTTVSSAEDVARVYMLLKPINEDTGKKHPIRLLILARKKLPDVHKRDRYWAFVDKVAFDVKEIGKELEERSYETKTRGERKVEPARPCAKGVYIIAEHHDHTHLAYCLEVPEEPGPAQEQFNIVKEGSYIITVKNPESPSPPWAGLSGKAKTDFPPEYQNIFRKRRFVPVNPTDLMDFPHAEIVLIGASSEVKEELGQAGEVLEEWEKEELHSMMVPPDKKVLEELELDYQKFKSDPLAGSFA